MELNYEHHKQLRHWIKEEHRLWILFYWPSTWRMQEIWHLKARITCLWNLKGTKISLCPYFNWLASKPANGGYGHLVVTDYLQSKNCRKDMVWGYFCSDGVLQKGVELLTWIFIVFQWTVDTNDTWSTLFFKKTGHSTSDIHTTQRAVTITNWSWWWIVTQTIVVNDLINCVLGIQHIFLLAV